jgi:hypothetical protein
MIVDVGLGSKPCLGGELPPDKASHFPPPVEIGEDLLCSLFFDY